MRGWRTCSKLQPLRPRPLWLKKLGSDRVDRARGTSLVIETTEEVADPPLGMPTEPSVTELLPEDEVEAMMPLLWMMLGLSLHTDLKGWALLNIIGLRQIRGPLVVSTP